MPGPIGAQVVRDALDRAEIRVIQPVAAETSAAEKPNEPSRVVDIPQEYRGTTVTALSSKAGSVLAKLARPRAIVEDRKVDACVEHLTPCPSGLGAHFVHVRRPHVKVVRSVLRADRERRRACADRLTARVRRGAEERGPRDCVRL